MCISDRLLWVVFLVLAHRRIQALATGRPPGPPAGGTVLGAAGVVAAAALVGAVVLMVPR
ncbi:hypothetical protein [Streptomyces specialis]|uniref:hypothetical protein n=1 Tax=Streptomyces specialis TaxID=498367 RepID=UPI000A699AFD|nr:hypothetical protein [Streptomyces specialis]